MTPFTGYYWIHFSVGIPNDTLADVYLLGFLRPLNIVRNYTTFTSTPITKSRDGIMFLQSSTKLWLSSDYAIYSDQYLQISFTGFPLTSLMDPLAVFSVAISTSIIMQINGRIMYDIVNIDTANAWHSVNSEYIAPLTGIYIISFSSGAFPEASHIVEIWVNNVHIASNIFYSELHRGIDVISRTIITSMMVGSRLYTQFNSQNDRFFSLYGSNRHHLTTLMGFLYSPYRLVPISWWVGREVSDFLAGEVYPFKFDYILNNEGKGWDSKSNKYLVPLAGVYYIHLTTSISEGRSKLELMRNGLPVMNVQLESQDITSYFCASRATLLRLAKFEELSIRLPSKFWIYSDIHRYVSFAGFRIYA